MLSAFSELSSCLIVEFESLALNMTIFIYLEVLLMSVGLCHAIQYGAENREPALNTLLSA